MNPSPPLPLENGALLIDNSFLELLQTCPRALEYNRLRKRELAATRPSLNFGTCGHLVWEHRYRTLGNAAPTPQLEEECGQIVSKYFAENPFPEDDFRTVNWAIELFVKRYNQRYALEPFQLLQTEDGQSVVELPFMVKLFDARGSITPSSLIPVYYTGKIDLPVSWDDSIMVGDHKTTSMMGDSFWDDLRVSPQLLGYCWGFWQTTGIRPAGFFVNAVRTRPQPMKPKGGLDAWWEENYQRSKEFVSVGQLDEWKANTIALVEEFLWHHSRSYFPMKKKWCSGKYGKCQYYSVCNGLPITQREEMLMSQLYMHNAWSPLRKVTK